MFINPLNNITIPEGINDATYSLNYEMIYCIFTLLFFTVAICKCCVIHRSTSSERQDYYVIHNEKLDEKSRPKIFKI